MNTKTVLEVLNLIHVFIPEAQKISRMYGIIHRQTPAEINGAKGFLIWDYMVFNEITFKDMNQNIYSLFKSADDDETENQWNELVKKYGV